MLVRDPSLSAHGSWPPPRERRDGRSSDPRALLERAYGAGISLSPVHIGILLPLLVGADPLRRAGWFLLGWALTTALAVALLIMVRHKLPIDMSMGTNHRTGLDLLVAGALLALGLKEPLRRGGTG